VSITLQAVHRAPVTLSITHSGAVLEITPVLEILIQSPGVKQVLAIAHISSGVDLQEPQPQQPPFQPPLFTTVI